ncbi:YbaB/EbfC family nucleoid-associated protein [Saccharopolyspora shandongensis]|uniref:YbaB/EbfC family nucleoid-associated protein n=1 Tax=Saccharopolyspora shandongensis TaxID=418495 RepID=UPI0033DCCCEF
MDGNILDPDGARERLAAWKGRIDKLAADTQTMSDRLQEVRVTASDPNGLAEVTIDSTGALVGLQLTSRIQRMAPDAVAQAIMATLGDAKNKLADQSQAIIADTVGTESPAARAIADSVERHLRTGPAPEPAASYAEDDDEGYEINTHRERW